MKRRRTEGLATLEALARANPADDAERHAFLALFDAIERGAITGSNVGFETALERKEEEGS